jgi:hypothetical protein
MKPKLHTFHPSDELKSAPFTLSKPTTFFAIPKWFVSEDPVHTLTGRVVCLNLVRPVTRWRRFKTWLGFIEKDAMVSSWRKWR